MIPLWSGDVFARWLIGLALGYAACWALVQLVNAAAEARARREGRRYAARDTESA